MNQNQFISLSEIQAIEASGHVASPAQVQALIRETVRLHNLVESLKSEGTGCQAKIKIVGDISEIEINHADDIIRDLLSKNLGFSGSIKASK